MSRAVGICVGAVTLSAAEKLPDGIAYHRLPHDGKVSETLKDFLSTRPGIHVGITGQKYRKTAPYASIPEPEAVELAFRHIRHHYDDIDTIVSAGAETLLAYSLDGSGLIRSVHTGSKCAAGTGEFFLQQVRRMGFTVEEAVHQAAGKEPYLVASRCSVFCKSDCTHALNKGIEKARVAAGLCRMLSEKITDLLDMAGARKALLIGGISRNGLVVEYVREKYPALFIPEQSECFEALGTLLWVKNNGSGTVGQVSAENIRKSSYPTHPPLKTGYSRVTLLEEVPGEYYAGEYVLGLDVGSTTTKAVLMRTDNQQVVSDVYLRTEGDPVGASRSCYKELNRKLPEGLDPVIAGLGVTGSGRLIAGLQALTDTIVNEIVAHARAAVHYDPDVETVFEIGGQDAKYTCLANQVPVDYAMNEACSAGTGSFLEEACLESFNLETGSIARIAMKGERPPDFNDQCSAFIGSDVKTAIHEGIGRDDIVAGLVYSVCRNYLTRVRGNRRVGARIFMQGGVCYNEAVPLAMAVLCDAEVTVPPRPGLMGAYGAALYTSDRIKSGLADRGSFDLSELAARDLARRSPFTCKGGADGCDRRCVISRYEINGGLYPFGGACEKYRRDGKGIDMNERPVDLVLDREGLVFGSSPQEKGSNGRLRVGIPASLLTNTFYPLYASFIENLGFEVVRSRQNGNRGMEKAGSAFCQPVLQSHGHLQQLLDQGVDWIFAPHVRNVPVLEENGNLCACPLVQAEPYILRSAFHDDLAGKLVTCILDLDDPGSVRTELEAVGRKLGVGKAQTARAFERAWDLFNEHRSRMLETGGRFIQSLEEDQVSIVLFGRSYNAFTSQANMGIPGKFASRGYPVIPYDMIPLPEDHNKLLDRMYWASGQTILQSAGYVRSMSSLFGVFITSFSCGPDSFILDRFRSIMGDKPYLVLELDTHTSDAGLDTRVEAFLEVVENYRSGGPSNGRGAISLSGSEPGGEGKSSIRSVDMSVIPASFPGVKVLVPFMGDISSRGLAAAMRYAGINADTTPPPGPEELDLGKRSASCRECLPYLLTAGSLHRYLRDREEEEEETLLYFMPEADGPCRFGAYSKALRDMIEREDLGDVQIISPTSSNSYNSFPPDFARRALLAASITDGLADIRAGLLAMAGDQDRAMDVLSRAEDSIVGSLASEEERQTHQVLEDWMHELSILKRVVSYEEVTKVLLTGEIYVRREAFSSYNLVERLAREGILVRTSPVMEWLLYIDHIVLNQLLKKVSARERLMIRLRNLHSKRMHAGVQNILETSGFYRRHHLDIGSLIKKGRHLLDPGLTGEAILTIGSTMAEMGDDVHGVISISPFGCMPGRIAEAIVSKRLEQDKYLFSRERRDFWRYYSTRLPLPFLALETDGNPLPQTMETKLDSFVLSAHRLNDELKELKRKGIY